MAAISSLSAQEKAKASSLPVAAGPAAIAAVTAAQAAVENEHERAMAVVRVMPWAVAFLARTKHFRGLLDKERLDIQGGDEASGGWRSRGTGISVRRELLLEDGLRALESLARGGSAALRDRVMVKFINAFGVEEVGIDVGGVFKDFWGDLNPVERFREEANQSSGHRNRNQDGSITGLTDTQVLGNGTERPDCGLPNHVYRKFPPPSWQSEFRINKPLKIHPAIARGKPLADDRSSTRSRHPVSQSYIQSRPLESDREHNLIELPLEDLRGQRDHLHLEELLERAQRRKRHRVPGSSARDRTPVIFRQEKGANIGGVQVSPSIPRDSEDLRLRSSGLQRQECVRSWGHHREFHQRLIRVGHRQQ